MSQVTRPFPDNDHPPVSGWPDGVLRPHEQILASFDPDLNHDLHFAAHSVLLTNERILARKIASDEADIQSIEIDAIRAVRVREQFGLGRLDLLSDDRILAGWRYTAAVFSPAHQFSKLIERQLGGKGHAELEWAQTVCPSCGAVLEPGETICPACAPSAAPPATKSLLRLWHFAKPLRWQILLGASCMFASTAFSMVTPYLTRPLLDDVLYPFRDDPENHPILWSVVLGLLAVALGASVLQWLFGWGRSYIMSWVSEKLAADLRVTTYGHLQRLSLEFFGGKRTGDLMSRIGSDTDRICNFLSLNLLDFANDLLMIVMTSVFLLVIDWRLALATLIPFPLIAWLIQAVRFRLLHGFSLGNRAWGEMMSVLADTIPGVRVVKAFAQEGREMARFDHANQHVLNSNDRVNRVWAFFGPMITLLTEVGMIVIWGFGVYRIMQGGITVGVLLVFVAYIARFYSTLDSMSRFMAAVQRAASSTYRIFEILDRSPSVPEPVKPVSPGRVQGRVEIRDVSFNYGSRHVIKGVSLTVEPGEMVGLVGPSGAGKSTLVNLVCRFYDVASGAILVDGVDIRSFPVQEYHRNIGIVLQDPFLFYGSVGENISYGRPEATRGEIIAAARAAKAHDFILRLPDGYDSLVGERGQSLSGGERQRISIARAILIDPRILILDEATSSVDTETEREIQEALDNLIQGRTTIAIAHRLSTLRSANKVVVMEDGRITEIGPHDELLQREGTYARLHQAQFELAQ